MGELWGGKLLPSYIAVQVQQALLDALRGAAEAARAAGQLDFAEIPSFVLEKPREASHGDLASNLALVLARPARKSPRQIAELLLKQLDCTGLPLQRVEIAGAGFINLYLDPAWVRAVPAEVLAARAEYGRVDLGEQQRLQVEFVSANPTGLLHVGHARGAALGDSLANLLQAAGYQVSREFYINDAGSQIEKLGESLEARYLSSLGRSTPVPPDGYHGEDLVGTVQRFIDRESDRWLNAEPEERRQALVAFTLKEKMEAIRTTLERFGVRFDVWFSEQQLHQRGEVRRVVAQLEARDCLYPREGALWFRAPGGAEDQEKDEVIIRSSGVPTYFAADIAYHIDKFRRGFDRIINIWGADHHGHVPRLKAALQALGYEPEKLEVILAQMVRLFRGGEQVRMSKRTGQYVTLEELLEEVGNDAARYFFVMRSPESHLDFDLDLAKSQSNENPVYYVQYAHARICSIRRQAREQGIELPRVEDCRLELLEDPAELALLKKVAELPLELAAAARSREPHRLAHYVYELASLFHTYYNACRVLVEDVPLRDARLILVLTVQVAVRNVLGILGVSAPERM